MFLLRKHNRRQRSCLSDTSSCHGQPPYSMGGIDLSSAWLDLVRQDNVLATIEIPLQLANSPHEDLIGKRINSSCLVQYGVRMVETATYGPICQEYVMEVDSGSLHPTIRAMNETLRSIHCRYEHNTSDDATTTTNTTALPMRSLQCQEAGGFYAQLQLVRTLRPAPSSGVSVRATTTNIPPIYHPETDSFVTGPLRLELRPLVGRIQAPTQSTQRRLPSMISPSATLSKTITSVSAWDIYHNVSPVDVRGHFLLLPTLSEIKNQGRSQVFLPSDCHDVIHFTDTIRPTGSLFIGYNSIGAGAPQNHIHCHAWPIPLLPWESISSINNNEKVEDKGGSPAMYPLSKVTSIYDFLDIVVPINEHGTEEAEDTTTTATISSSSDCTSVGVEVSLLKYPVFCVLLSSPSTQLDLLGTALAIIVKCLGTSPFNLGFLNRRVAENAEEEVTTSTKTTSAKEKTFVDVYVFVRSKERSNVLPTSLRLGVSEMMGVFHAQSKEEWETLVSTATRRVFQGEKGESLPNEKEEGNKENDDVGDSKVRSLMEAALADVSVTNEEELWLTIKENLETLSRK